MHAQHSSDGVDRVAHTRMLCECCAAYSNCQSIRCHSPYFRTHIGARRLRHARWPVRVTDDRRETRMDRPTARRSLYAASCWQAHSVHLLDVARGLCGRSACVVVATFLVLVVRGGDSLPTMRVRVACRAAHDSVEGSGSCLLSDTRTLGPLSLDRQVSLDNTHVCYAAVDVALVRYHGSARST